MAGKSRQPSHEPPFQAPVTLIESMEGLTEDGAGRERLKQMVQKYEKRPHRYKTARGLEEGPSHDEATTIHVSLHL